MERQKQGSQRLRLCLTNTHCGEDLMSKTERVTAFPGTEFKRLSTDASKGGRGEGVAVI